jgi:hypothetical protein
MRIYLYQHYAKLMTMNFQGLYYTCCYSKIFFSRSDEMDIYSFINSRDVAEHCRSLQKEWNTFEMAVIIGRSSRPLQEKHEAYRELIKNYPDMPTPKAFFHESRPSLHKELEKIIDYYDRLYEIFNTAEQGAAYIYTAWDSVQFDKADYQPFECRMVYSTFENAWDGAMKAKKLADEKAIAGILNAIRMEG